MKLNQHGGALLYALVLTVVVALMSQVILRKTDMSIRQQATIQRALDVTLFANGIRSLLKNSQACSKILGYGYMTPTSASTASDFDPTSLAPAAEKMQPVNLLDPSGAGQVMYSGWDGDLASAPPTSVALLGTVIRQIFLQREPGIDAEQGSIVLNHEIESATPLAQPFDIKAVQANLVLVFENVDSKSAFLSRSLTRTIELTVYTMKPQSSPTGWKVLTCSPRIEKANMADLKVLDTVSISGYNQASCPEGTFTSSLNAVPAPGGFNLSVTCDRVTH